VTYQNNESKKYNRWGWQVYLGLIDAHCHFTAMDYKKLICAVLKVWLKSLAFASISKDKITVGNVGSKRLASKKYPTKADLDAAFPDIPVVLNRVDGHAIIVNSKALQMAGITKNTMLMVVRMK
jgi:predicted amidohydrolase YtcJ